MKQRENSAAGMVVGMAAGAALGAAGAMMATQSKRQMRRNVRKVMKGAENAVMQLDKMATDFVEKHIDCGTAKSAVPDGTALFIVRLILPRCTSGR